MANVSRKSIRFKNFDYSQTGAYYITICVDKMQSVFGKVKGQSVLLNELGSKAKGFWEEIPKHFQNTVLDEFIIMPNHIHGVILIINDIPAVGVQYIEPLQNVNRYQKTIPGSIGSIIRNYKGALTRWCGKNGYSEFKWQRNFFERVIRNDSELEKIRKYIRYNPLKRSFNKKTFYTENYETV